MNDRRKLVGNDIISPVRRQRPVAPTPELGRRPIAPPPKTVQSAIPPMPQPAWQRTVRQHHSPSVVAAPKMVETTSVAGAPTAITTIFNDIAYDLFAVVVLGIIAALTSWIDWVFLAYAIFVLVTRVSSQRLFSAALICLVIIPIASLLNRTELADNFAVMTFYFMLIGLIVIIVELKRKPTE